MSNLLSRIRSLESNQIDDQILVYIFRWSGGLGERNRVKFNDKFIERIDGENEEEYLERAEIEIRRMADPNQKVLTAFAWN